MLSRMETTRQENDAERHDPAGLLAAVAALCRRIRATRALSQRELAQACGVSKGFVGRVESQEVTAATRAWLDGLAALGLHLHVVVTCRAERAELADDPAWGLHDAGDRRLPAHREVRRERPYRWWYHARDSREGASDRLFRAGPRRLRPGEPDPDFGAVMREVRESTRVRGADDQDPSAASTTCLASACTWARCSGPRKDSA